MSPRIVEILYQIIAFLGGGLLSGLIRPFIRVYLTMLGQF